MLRRATDMRTNAATALPTNLLISTKKNWPGTIVSNVLVTSGYIIRLLGDANALCLSYKLMQHLLLGPKVEFLDLLKPPLRGLGRCSRRVISGARAVRYDGSSGETTGYGFHHSRTPRRRDVSLPFSPAAKQNAGCEDRTVFHTCAVVAMYTRRVSHLLIHSPPFFEICKLLLP